MTGIDPADLVLQGDPKTEVSQNILQFSKMTTGGRSQKETLLGGWTQESIKLY